MPIKGYGVLKGEIIGSTPEADDDHYQILVAVGKQRWRIAVNVKSQESPSDVLYLELTSLPKSLTTQLGALKPGFTALKSKPGGLAQDFARRTL